MKTTHPKIKSQGKITSSISYDISDVIRILHLFTVYQQNNPVPFGIHVHVYTWSDYSL